MGQSSFTLIDHVQLAMPPDEEQKARAFYVDLLGMTELPKPPELARRGGCWFESGGVQLHLGVEKEFRPANKAHPALRCRNYASSATIARRGNGSDRAARYSGSMPGHVHDPFGNRIELISG
jgi:hypothetical protein